MKVEKSHSLVTSLQGMNEGCSCVQDYRAYCYLKEETKSILILYSMNPECYCREENAHAYT